jgi:AraC-like DNA-binding protein
MSARLLRIHHWETLATRAGFQVKTMADLCRTNRRTLERFFQKAFHKTPKLWLREVRCRKALKLLWEGLSNKAIVEKLYFGNDSHFCHEFRRFYGISPQTMGLVFKNEAIMSPVGGFRSKVRPHNFSPSFMRPISRTEFEFYESFIADLKFD